MHSGLKLLIAALAVLAGCQSSEPTRPPAPDPTEVVVVATFADMTDMPDDYTPAHLRALLAKIAPAVLAVEAPATAPDPWAKAPRDLRDVTRPWAEKNGIPVVPVGCLDAEYAADEARMVETLKRDVNAGLRYAVAGIQLQNDLVNQPPSCEFLNSPEARDFLHTYYETVHKLYGQETPWETWNGRIAANVVALCREHPGQRVAVVFGARHSDILQRRLAAEPGLVVLLPEKFLPLFFGAVQDATWPTDALKALGALQGDFVPPSEFDRLKKRLDQVKARPELEGDYHLFSGLYLAHLAADARHLPPEAVGYRYVDVDRTEALALREFEEVRRLDASAISAFDGVTPLREAGAMWGALARDLLDSTLRARTELAAVAARQDFTPATRAWAERELKALPKPRKIKYTIPGRGLEEIPGPAILPPQELRHGNALPN